MHIFARTTNGHAEVAELVDAPDSGSGPGNRVEVRVLSSARVQRPSTPTIADPNASAARWRSHPSTTSHQTSSAPFYDKLWATTEVRRQEVLPPAQEDSAAVKDEWG